MVTFNLTVFYYYSPNLNDSVVPDLSFMLTELEHILIQTSMPQFIHEWVKETYLLAAEF